MELLPLSYINQYAYCPRRFWYMHVQGEMVENVHVVRGQQNHANVNAEGYAASAAGVTAYRRVHVFSHGLGISGICDLVEVHDDGTLVPVEYKQGQRGKWNNDQAQLCAQALCLEEMTGQKIPRGEIFYFGSRRRQVVEFTAALRDETLELIRLMHFVVASGQIPAHTDRPARCRGCSLQPVCLPQETQILAAGGPVR